MNNDDDITALLNEWRAGSRDAFERLFSLVYGELRRIAQRELGRERSEHTLGATGLIHEAYLKLVDQTRARYQDRAHFFSVAAQAMRRLLVDYARRHRTLKRGGDQIAVSFDDVRSQGTERAEILVQLDEALSRLAEVDSRLSRIVECRFFGGLTEEETAETLAMTSRTVRRDWVKAKAWLREELG